MLLVITTFVSFPQKSNEKRIQLILIASFIFEVLPSVSWGVPQKIDSWGGKLSLGITSFRDRTKPKAPENKL